MENFERSWAFNRFACNDDGNSIRRRIHAMARHYAAGHMAKLDANWHSIEFEFSQEGMYRGEILELPLSDEGACRVEFDYRPARVVLVGPNVGHVTLTDEVFRFIPEPLVMLMRACDVLQEWFHTLHNPKHHIELVDGKTVIKFENCASGVVRNVRGVEEEFDIEPLQPNFGLSTDQRHFTRASLMEGFRIDGYVGQPVDVDYFPRLSRDGQLLKTPEEYIEHGRIAREKFDAERAAERVRREAEAAAAEAALTPEQRAERDARNEKLRAEGRLLRRLLKVTPGP